jgi:hypothetical protein
MFYVFNFYALLYIELSKLLKRQKQNIIILFPIFFLVKNIYKRYEIFES